MYINSSCIVISFNVPVNYRAALPHRKWTYRKKLTPNIYMKESEGGGGFDQTPTAGVSGPRARRAEEKTKG